MISYARLDLSIPIETWQTEIDALPGKWTTHFNYKHFEGEWTVLALRSPGGRSDQIIPDLMQQEDYADTSLLQYCPSIKTWLNLLQCPLMSVRLLNLKSKSVIKEHRDHELSFESGEARLHIPIFTNRYVEFYVNDVLLKMKEGECWYVNVNLPHRVANNGDTERIHLVVDCTVNDWLKDLFARSECTYVVRADSNQDVIKIIRELRIQNTSTSNHLADQLEKDV